MEANYLLSRSVRATIRALVRSTHPLPPHAASPAAMPCVRLPLSLRAVWLRTPDGDKLGRRGAGGWVAICVLLDPLPPPSCVIHCRSSATDPPSMASRTGLPRTRGAQNGARMVANPLSLSPLSPARITEAHSRGVGHRGCATGCRLSITDEGRAHGPAPRSLFHSSSPCAGYFRILRGANEIDIEHDAWAPYVSDSSPRIGQ